MVDVNIKEYRKNVDPLTIAVHNRNVEHEVF